MVTGVRLAVVGATGAVGRTIVRLLEERNVPVSSLGLFASRAHEHGIELRDEPIPCTP
jgi:aspartate-semialdehyde dehydrogenase